MAFSPNRNQQAYLRPANHELSPQKSPQKHVDAWLSFPNPETHNLIQAEGDRKEKEGKKKTKS